MESKHTAPVPVSAMSQHPLGEQCVPAAQMTCRGTVSKRASPPRKLYTDLPT